MQHQFRVCPDGTVRFWDSRVAEPLSFTQIADTHLYPPAEDRDSTNETYRKSSCNGGLRALNMPYNALKQILASMLDDVKARGDNFVAWSGDILDVYDPETAALPVQLCRERDLPYYFQMGNHDWDFGWSPSKPSDWSEMLPATMYDIDLRNQQAEQVMTGDWGMPGRYYAFELKGVRFINLDTIHRTVTDPSIAPIAPASTYDEAQAGWLINQLQWDGPIVLFQHVPFSPLTPAYQTEPWRSFVYGCVLDEDPVTHRVSEAVRNCPNLLGVFVGHKHLRSEDPLGSTWQFMVGLTAEGHFRRVVIDNQPVSASQD